MNISSNEYYEGSSRNFNTANSTNNADNLNSYPREASDVLINSASNCFNEILLLTKDIKTEDPFYSSSNIDFNIEDFFTY